MKREDPLLTKSLKHLQESKEKDRRNLVYIVALPELVFFLVKEDISRALSRGEEVGSRDPETLKERGGYEMWSVGLDGREGAELELGVRWEAEELLAEVLEFRVELL